MWPVIEAIRRDITPKQRADLITRLHQEGFMVGIQGHIRVAQPKPNHPVDKVIYKDYADAGNKYDLPVGFLERHVAELGDTVIAEIVNTDKSFPEDYHTRLRRIFESV